MDTKTLTLMAECAEHRACELDAGITDHDRKLRQALRIAASDARQTAEAANGYGSVATLHVAMVIDNDRELAGRRLELMRESAPDYGEISEDLDAETIARKVEEADASACVDFADALRDACEDWAGFEGLRRAGAGERDYAGELIGDPAGLYSLPGLAHAMARVAMTQVDWIGLARHYMEEARLNGGPDNA